MQSMSPGLTDKYSMNKILTIHKLGTDLILVLDTLAVNKTVYIST